MAESLLAKLGDLNFTAEEQDAVVVTTESVAIPAEDFACSLVGRVVTSTPIDGNRLIRLFRTIWKEDKVHTITELNPNFFLIAFASSTSRDNILKRGPWEFQKHWFALEHADPMRTIHDYSFQYMCIWVRIHNIPISLMTAALARTLGACIGKVVMTDTRLEDGNMGEFMRVRISFDTTKPLRRCVVLRRPGAKAIMCPLQYERLPLFCHGCGLLGHAVLSCATTPKSDVQKLQYGAWMRAPQPTRPTASRPRGRVTLVHDDMEVPAPTPSVASGSPTVGASDPLSSPPLGAGDNPTTPVSTVPSDRPVSPALASADNEHDSYDPVVHSATSDMLEDALAVPSGCALLVDIDGIIKSHGADLVDDAIDAVADTLIRLCSAPSHAGPP
ncbi:hypothetical protein V6N13_061348 [Hibiscus sabdariffa]